MDEQRPPLGIDAARLEELRARLFDAASTEPVPLARLAGRVLAEAVVAGRDVPEYPQATMDGFAVAAADTPLDLRGADAGPGDAPPDHESGTAYPVATGGPTPVGADAVIPVEDATVEDGQLVAVDGDPGSDQHVLPKGSVVASGETVLEAGRGLAPRDAVVLRELGRDRVSVRERLSVGILATGTEIHEGHEPDRDSEMLANLVRGWGGDPTLVGSVPDDADRVGERIVGLAADHDVVLTTGGTSVGRPDETAGALADRAELVVAGPAVRPGSNASVAWLAGERTVVSALPGKPGAAFVSALLLVRPVLAGTDDRPETGAYPTVAGRLMTDLAAPDADLTFVVPVEFTNGVSVVPFGHPASSVRLYGDRFRPHRVASCVNLSAADGVALLRDDLTAGDDLSVIPFPAVER